MCQQAILQLGRSDNFTNLHIFTPFDCTIELVSLNTTCTLSRYLKEFIFCMNLSILVCGATTAQLYARLFGTEQYVVVTYANY